MIRQALVAFFEAWARQLVQALQDWLDRKEREALIRSETTAINAKEAQEADVANAERINRAVEAVRTDGHSGVRGDAPARKADTRGYRD